MADIAILGFGTVGSGVAEVLQENAAHIAEKLHEPLQLKYILDVRDFPDSPFSDKVVHNFSQIEKDPDIQIVVETIGGVRAAKEYSERALRAGKSVVTSNKELVAAYGYELMCLAKENGVSYLYEASVGGGIPVLHPLKQCLTANKITEICGILNGTTNYILTQMSHFNLSLETALQDAQRNGYAEADPTADLEGIDACRKICILASLAFGKKIEPAKISAEGITAITADDVAYAASGGFKIKLLGRAILCPAGKVQSFVSPHLVRKDTPLGAVEDVFNAIVIHGNAVGDVMFFGRGAGKMPTASAVVSDVMEAFQNRGSAKYLDWAGEEPELMVSSASVISRWYVRAGCTKKALTAALGEVEFLTGNHFGQDIAALTKPMTAAELERRLARYPVFTCFRILED